MIYYSEMCELSWLQIILYQKCTSITIWIPDTRNPKAFKYRTSPVFGPWLCILKYQSSLKIFILSFSNIFVWVRYIDTHSHSTFWRQSYRFRGPCAGKGRCVWGRLLQNPIPLFELFLPSYLTRCETIQSSKLQLYILLFDENPLIC